MHSSERLYPWQEASFNKLDQLALKSHALLVSGEKGIGKQHLLTQWIKKQLCLAGQHFACGQCQPCLLFAAGTHPDYFFLAPEGRLIKVSQIRQMTEKLNQTAQLSGKKVVLIAPAENMNLASANALLKCLEEPSPGSLLVLLSHNPERLLPTIRSRCQQLLINKPSMAEARAFLAENLPNVESLDELLQLANFNPLEALAMAENGSLLLYQATKTSLQRLETSANLLQEADSLLKLIQQAEDSHTALEQWLIMNQRLLWQMVLKHYQLSPESVLAEICQKADFLRRAYWLLEKLQESLQQVQAGNNPNSQLLLENCLINWQRILKN